MSINGNSVFEIEIEHIKNEEKPIVLFGVLAMGSIAKKSLDNLGKAVQCFCDNNKKKQGTIIEGLEVLSVQEAYNKYPDAKIIICSFRKETVDEVKKQLKKIGFLSVEDSFALLYYYQTQIMKRPVDKNEFEKTIMTLKNRTNSFTLNRVSLPITTKCTLRCQDCGALIPHIKNPINYDKEDIVRSVMNLANSVDAIKEILIFGGEPFIHKDLIEICERISKISKVGQILIITNATINLELDKMNKLKKSVLYISISDYGPLSKEKLSLAEMAKRVGICVEITEQARSWTDFGEIAPRLRDSLENEKIFERCSHREDCHSVINGEYHFCGRSAFGGVEAFIPNTQMDYINLLKENYSAQETRKDLMAFLKNTKKITACDYCDWVFSKPIQPAIQVNKGDYSGN